MRDGIRTQRKATRILDQGVVKISSTPNESESVTRRSRKPAESAPCCVIMTLPDDVYQRLPRSQEERRYGNHQRKNRDKNQDSFQEETR